MTTSYTLVPTTELDGNANLADLWATNNGSYIQQMNNQTSSNNPNNTMSPVSPNSMSLQAQPNLAYARRYAASKPPYSCKLKNV